MPSDPSTPSDSPPPMAETVFEFFERAAPDADTDATHVADTTPAQDAVIIYVKLDPVTAEIAQSEFYDVFNNGDPGDVFSGSIEAYPLPDHGDEQAVVFRVYTPNGEAGYYHGTIGDTLYFGGRISRDNWAVGHLDTSYDTKNAFDARAMGYIEPLLLFDEDGANQADQIRRNNQIIDAVTSDEFMEFIDELSEMDEDQRERVLDRMFDEDADD